MVGGCWGSQSHGVGDGMLTGFCLCDELVKQSNLREERIILAHGFSWWLVDMVVLW